MALLMRFLRRLPRRNRFIQALVIIMVAALSILGGLWSAWLMARLDHSTPVLSVEPKALDIGDAWSNERFQWQIPIKNISGERVKVTGIRTSCMCGSVEPQVFALNAGEAVNLQATINLSSILSGQEVESFTLSLMPDIASHPDSGKAWQLKGRVLQPYHIREMLDFEDRLVAGRPFSARSLVVSLHPDLSALQVEAPASFFASCSCEPVPSLNRDFRVTLRPHESLSVGFHKVALDITAIDKANRKQRLPPLVVSLKVMPDLQLLPEALPLGIVTVKQSHSCFFEIRSRNDKQFKLITTEIRADSFVASIREELPGQFAARHSFELGITCLKEGNQVHNLPIGIQYLGTAVPISVQLPVSYIGETQRIRPKSE